MSNAVCSYLRNLFCSEEKSDCLIAFCNRASDNASTESDDCFAYDCESKSEYDKNCRYHRGPSFLAKAFLWVQGYGKHGEDAAPDGCIQPFHSDLGHAGLIGSPLPAHQIVVCGGSQFLRDQVDDWVRNHGPAGKPILKMQLDGNEELPYALSALRFIYAGALDVDGVGAILHVRNKAIELRVAGCVEACDASILGIIDGSNLRPTDLGPLSGAIELYAHRHLLEDLAVGPSTLQSFRQACRQQLVKYSAAFIDLNGYGIGEEQSHEVLGELLVWAFGDAPSILSDPRLQQPMEALPAAAMEALLGCKNFATDEEATVLLLLVRWLEVNIVSTDSACLTRLCRQVRLAQLSSTYLHVLLPAMAWFPITDEEHLFLCDFVHAPDTKKPQMIKAASDMYDMSSPWYSTVPRPEPLYGTVRSYEWSIDKEDLMALLAQEKDWVDCQFSNGASRVVSQGFEWFVGLVCCREGDAYAAITYLDCQLAPSVRPAGPEKMVAIIGPGPAHVVVHRWQEDGTREEAYSFALKPGELMDANIGGGQSRLLPLDVQLLSSDSDSEFGDLLEDEARDRSTAGRLAPLAAYLRDGKLSGAIVFG